MKKFPTKKVSFLDTQSFTPDEILEIQQENILLKNKLFELEEFCNKAEKCFTQHSQDIEQMQEMASSIEALKTSESKYKQKLKELESLNLGLVNENKTLKNEVSDLRMKKQLLESEIERLNESVYAQEMEIRKNNMKKNPGLVNLNPNLAQVSQIRVGLGRAGDELKRPVEGFDGKKDSRSKLSDHHIVKMRNLATRNLSCKNLASQSFSFTSPPTSPKPQINPNASTSQLTNVEELKRLIRQAKENHMRLKTTF